MYLNNESKVVAYRTTDGKPVVYAIRDGDTGQLQGIYSTRERADAVCKKKNANRDHFRVVSQQYVSVKPQVVADDVVADDKVGMSIGRLLEI